MIDNSAAAYERLKQKKIFLFDIDGTLALDNELIPGAKEMLDYFYEHGKKIYFTTNNSTRSMQGYIDYFLNWDMKVNWDCFVTAGQVTAQYCEKNFSGRKIFLLGTPEFQTELEKRGLQIITTYEEDASCVLAAFDTTLTFQKLVDACRILQDENIPFIATNPDLCCPTKNGSVPDCGSICMMIENATGRKPRYIGKPSPDIIHECLKRSGCGLDDAVMIGDRLYTDILCAANTGIDSVIVYTGETTKRQAIDSNLWITFGMDSVQDLYDFFRKVD